MRRILLHALSLLALLALPSLLSAQLSGNYTINPSGSGSTNYTSISAALSDINSKGISGPVNFTLSPGTYSDYIYFSSVPTGVKGKNTITFDGVSAGKVRIKYSSYPIYLSSTKGIVMKNITFEGTSVYTGYMYYADSCVIDNCVLLNNATTTSSSYRVLYLYMCNGNTVSNSRLVGGYYTIYNYGTSSSYTASIGNVYENNRMVYPYYTHIYNYYSSGSQFNYNELDSTRSTSTSYKVYNYYGTNSQFVGNKILYCGTDYYMGLYMYYENYYANTNRSLVANNFIGGQPTSYMYGVYHTSNSLNVDYRHNTIVNNSATTSGYAFYMASGSKNRIIGNNFVQSSTSGTYCPYISSYTYVDSFDYNNYYNASSSRFVYFGGVRSNLAALKTYGSTYGFNANDINVNPNMGPRDWDAEPIGLNNQGRKSIITTDIDGDPRPTSPDTKVDIGCNDYYLPANDAGISGFPVISACPGTVNVSAFVKNYGTATLTGCDVDWAISTNGSAFSSKTGTSFSGSLGSGASTSISLGSFTLVNGNTYTVKAYTSNPNSVGDGKNLNDTSYITVQAAMSGTFTIGGSGADYSTISAACADLMTKGACGPVTFRLGAGTYNDRIVLGNVAGTSATNFVRFVGKGRNKTTLSNSGSSYTDAANIDLAGASYIYIDSMRIEGKGSYGVCVWNTGGASYNRFTNCDMIQSTSSTSSSYAIAATTGSKSSYSGTGSASGEHNYFENNRFIGGYYGLTYTGASTSSTNNGMDVINCQFRQQYQYPTYFYYTRDKRIVSNSIDSVRNSTGYGLYNYYGIADSIVGNYVNCGYYSLNIYYNNYYGTSSDTSYVYNNILTGTISSYNSYLYYATRIRFYHNSFSGSPTSYLVYGYNNTYCDFRNNSFKSDGSTTTMLYFPNGVTTGGIWDNNNYYGPNHTYLINFNGSSYTDLAAWQLGYSGYNAASISVDPGYVSSTDLHSFSTNINNMGTNATRWLVKTDFDGEARPFAPDNTVDIGADEYYLAPYDLDVTSVMPPVVGIGNNTITVTIKNNGINPIVNDVAYMAYKYGSGSWVYQTVNVYDLGLGEDSTFDFTTMLSVSSGSSSTLCAQIDSGITGDPDISDELCVNTCVGIEGNYTIKPSGGDFSSIQSAVNAISSCGVSGPITFTVDPGTYTGQVVIPQIAGASATNTITFQGAGKYQSIIKYTGTSTTDWMTLLFNGADYISFNDFTIEGAGASYAVCAYFTGSADYNSFNNCLLLTSKTATSSYVIPIVASGSITSFSTSGNNGSYNSFTNCRVIGGYYGTYIYGMASASPNLGWKFINTDFRYAYSYGMYTYYTGQKTVRNISVDSLRSTSGYAWMNYYGISDTIDASYFRAPYYSLYNYYQNYYGKSADTGFVTNNMFISYSGSSSYNVYAAYNYNTKWLNNSFYGNNTTGLVYSYYNNNSVIQNNSFYNISSSGYCVYFYNPTMATGACDYNNYYAPSASTFMYWYGSTYSNLAALQSGVTTQNANCISVDPQYFSTEDLHTGSLSLNNAGINRWENRHDFDGDNRPLAPDKITDIGADEYYLPPVDLDVVTINPSKFTSGTNTISVTLKQKGTDTLFNETVYIEYSVNGGTAVKDTVTIVKLDPSATTGFTFTTKYTAATGVAYADLCVKFSAAFKTDPDGSNDEMCQAMCFPASGSYTIDKNGGGTFMNFAEAVEYLNCNTIAGPVTITVKDGDYNEKVVIGALAGASSTNTVTFVGQSKKAVITSGGVYGDCATVRLDGASYIVFDGLTINSTDANYAWGVHLMNNATYNTIKNCEVNVSPGSTSSYVQGIMGVNSIYYYSSTGNAANYNTITGNRIVGGYHGVYFSGTSTSTLSTQNEISNNVLRKQYYYGIATNYMDKTIMQGNDVDSMRTSGYAINNTYSRNSRILNNTLKGSYTAIYLNYENYYGTTDSSIVTNNMIGYGYGTGNIGIYSYYSPRITIAHNTIHSNTSSITPSYANIYLYYGDYNRVKNNILTNNTSGVLFTNYFSTLPSGYVDYNDYYAPNAPYKAYDANYGYFTSLASWKSSVSSQNANSIELDPGYASNSDLHAFSNNINNVGDNSVGIGFDFDYDSRPFSPDVTVDMGADELYIKQYNLDAQALIGPAIPKLGNNTISAKFVNRGLKDFTNEHAVVSYSINSGSKVFDTLKMKNLAVGHDTTFVFGKAWNISSNANYTICIEVDTIIGVDKDANDVVCDSRCTGMAGVYTVGASGADFSTLSAAINKLNCGMLGDVTIRVLPGSYSGAVAINDVGRYKVRIVGSGVNKTKITSLGGGSGNFATITVIGKNQVTIDSITIENTAINNGYGIQFTQSADSCTINNCIIKLPTTGLSSNSACISTSPSTTTLGNFGANANYLTVENNRLVGGYYGINMWGQGFTNLHDSGTTITNNTLRNQYFYGIFNYTQAHLSVTNNSIDSMGYQYGYGYQSYYGWNHNISNNTIHGIGAYGTYHYYLGYYVDQSSTISNNIIGDFKNPSYHTGIYQYLNMGTKVYHNTVATTGTTVSSSYASIFSTSGIDNEYKNNILTATGGGYTLSLSPSSIVNGAIDNNLYNHSGSLVYYNGSVYSSLSNWISANASQNASSVSVNPMMPSIRNPKPSAWQAAMGGVGVGVSEDIEGISRHALMPSIGAIEVRKDVSVLSIDTPSSACYLGMEEIRVSISNTSTEYSLTAGETIYIGFMANGQSDVDTLVIPSTIAPGFSGNHIFNSKLDMSTAGTYAIKAYMYLPYDGDRSGDTAYSNVMSYPKPVSGISAAATCLGDAAELMSTATVSSGSIASYNWSLGDATTASSEDVTHTYTSVNTYNLSLEVTSDKGCKDTAYSTIKVNYTPTAAFTTANVCDEDDAMFTDGSSITSGSLNHNWDFDDASSSSSASPTHLYATDGSYDVKLVVTESTTGCKDSVTKSITVYPTPSADFSYADVCDKETMTFTDKGSVSSGTYSNVWSFGDGSKDNTASTTHTYSAANTYSVKLVSSTTQGCKDSVSKSVTVNPLPVASISLSDMCFGDVMKPVDNSTGNITNWEWDFGDGTGTSTSGTPSYTYASSGIYTVELVVTTAKGCTDTTSGNVEVSSQPKAAFTVGNGCITDNIQFVNTTSVSCGVVTKYSWDFGDGTSSTSVNPTHKFSTSGTHTVKLVITLDNSTKDSVTRTLDIYLQPTAAFSNNATCTGKAVQFTNSSSATSGTSVTGYNWVFGDGGTSTQKNPMNTYSTSGNYNVYMIATDNRGCKDTSFKKVTVSPMPSISFSTTNKCVDQATNFTNKSSVSSGTLSYKWNFGDGSTSTTTSPSKTYTSASYYQVKLVGTTDAGCKDSSTTTIQAYAKPIPAFSASNVCDKGAMSFSNSTSGASSYSWNFGDGSSASTSTNPSYTYASAGSYTVTLTATTSNGCSDNAAKTMTVYALPTPSFTAAAVCDGNSVSFKNTSSGASSYSWVYGDGSGSTVTNPSYKYASAGTYTATLTATSSNSCSASSSSSVTVNANPTVSVSTANSCNGDSVKFATTASGATSYAWSFGDATSSTKKSPGHMYATSGSYTASVTAKSSAGCETTVSKSVDVYPVPTVSFSQSNVCQGSAMSFTNGSKISSGSLSYSWDFGDKSGSSNNVSPSYTYASAGTYTVTLTATSDKGCSKSTSSTITVYSNPVAAFTTANQCAGDAVSFTNKTTGAASYSWAFGDGNTSTSTSPSNTYLNAGTYTATLTAVSSNGCSVGTSTVVTAYANPVANFAVSNACDKDSVKTTNYSTGASSYKWRFGDNKSATSSAPGHVYKRSGSFNVSLISTTSNGCQDSMSRKVSVYALPSTSFSATTACLGDATSFSNTGSGATGYSWDFGDATGSVLENPSHSYASAGTYKVTLVSESNQGCKSTTSNNVTVNSVPVASFSTANVCAADTAKFTNSSTGAASYKWAFGDGKTGTAANGTNKYSNAGKYLVQLTAVSAAGCSNTTSQSIEIYEMPVSGFTTNGICLDNAVAYNESVKGNITSYTWNFGDGSGSFDRKADHQYSATGVYDVSLAVVSVDGCSDVAMSSLEIFPNPSASFSAADQCAGLDVTITNSSTIAAGSIASSLWNFDDGSGSSDDSPVHAFATAGTYNVALISTSDQGCSDLSEMTITINPNPEVTFTSTDGCSREETSFMNGSTISTGIATYAWDFNDGEMSSEMNPTHTYAKDGSYDVMLTATSDMGCVVSNTMTLVINEKPIATFAVAPVCLNEETTVPDSLRKLINKDWSYTWYAGDGNIYTDTIPNVVYTAAGTYDVALSITTPFGCSDSSAFTAIVFELPDASFDVVNKTNQRVAFEPVMGAIAYAWSFGDGNTSDEETPEHSYAADGVYTVELTTTNDKGCTSTSSQQVTVSPNALGTIGNANLVNVYPNPFTTTTQIGYELSKPSFVKIDVYDIQGRLQSTVVNGNQDAGQFVYQLDKEIQNVSGTVIIRFTVDETTKVLEVIRLK